MGSKFDFIDEELSRRSRLKQQRRLQSVEPGEGAWVKVGGRDMINFCSNDYLGLARHPLLSRRASEFLHCFGTGSTASRLVCGNQVYFEPVEERLAALKGTEAALIFNSGFQANVSVLPALADRNSLILSDRLNHNSLIQGIRLASCRVEIFNHNDLNHLRSLLQTFSKEAFSRILIVTESIFSMDGDQCPVREMVALAQQFNALLVVDEAHATGVAGPRGMGLTCGEGVDVTIGTFSKGCGSFGAYVACSQKLHDYLINCCGGIIYSTALPPAVLGAISGALELIPEMEAQRRELHLNAERLRSALGGMDWDCGRSTTQIVPVVVGKEADTLALSQWLETNQIFAAAIRPPTVEKDKSRIRLAVTALHQEEDIERVVDAFRRWGK
ncbi:MAG: 8-amino-7-oxononanoate synthase [Desulfobacteraceae bacterium]|nr:8-amino-7-oxononanoate synthase [Desulfobacteraceae bacterium]